MDDPLCNLLGDLRNLPYGISGIVFGEVEVRAIRRPDLLCVLVTSRPTDITEQERYGTTYHEQAYEEQTHYHNKR